ncbi:MAG: hypothetical protein QGG67_19080 [Gammaproteobacteria bacterium]|jgi:hypothetical protein|nr:hypothetical protein [Gammaproteobacteria bacterium]MDP6098066.1 hypothetical protein [Gammaproteobacteria bacterium]HJO11271.1 hypothetical protein [Gammaproteobacteria bacterium]|tara:strand:- start:516 stop:752 length:237 start_codon:yes stop_codon:yes gene_type:complete
MARLYATLQIIGAVVLGVIAAATAVNMILIATRPDTISVVNVIVGQTLIIVCLIALARLLILKGIHALRASGRSKPES